MAGPSSTFGDRRIIVGGNQVHVAQPIIQFFPENSALAGPSMISNNHQVRVLPVSDNRDLPAPANNTEGIIVIYFYFYRFPFHFYNFYFISYMPGLEKMVKKLASEVFKQKEKI